MSRRESSVSGAADRVSFEQFVEGSSSRMLTMAMLLTGRSRVDAEDLLQAMLERAYRRAEPPSWHVHWTANLSAHGWCP